MEVYRNYNLRLYPTPRQARRLGEIIESQRQLYNAALEERVGAYQKTGKGVGFIEQQRSLTVCRRECPEVAADARHVQSTTLRRLDFAYKHFFRRAREGRAGFPKFKGAEYWRSVTFQNSKGHKPLKEPGRLRFPKLGLIKYRSTVPHHLITKICQVTVGRDAAGRWWASIAAKVEEPRRKRGRGTVGIDLNTGANAIVATNGDWVAHYPLPDLSKYAEQIKRLREVLRRKERGSKEFERVRKRFAKVHARAAAIVKDWQHKTTTELSKRGYTMAVERLEVSRMVRSRGERGTSESIRQSMISRAFLDAAPRQTIDMLAYKCGRMVQVPTPWTSQRCSECGHIEEGNRNREEFVCLECGSIMHADENAARNVLAMAAGDVVENGEAGLSPNPNRATPELQGGGNRITTPPLL